MWQTQAKDGEGRGGKCDREKGEGSSVSFPPLPSPFLPFCPTLLTPAMQGNNIVHILLITSQSSSVPLACSKRSDSGERCRVKKAMKSRGGLGREVPLLLPRFYFFALLFTSHRSPLSERLEQASVPQSPPIFWFCF